MKSITDIKKDRNEKIQSFLNRLSDDLYKHLTPYFIDTIRERDEYIKALEEKIKLTSETPSPETVVHVIGDRYDTGVKDMHGTPIYLGDRVRYNLEGENTKREYWNPEYEVIFNPPAFSLKHVGGGKDGGSWDFILKHGGGNKSLEIIAKGPYSALQTTPTPPQDLVGELKELKERYAEVNKEYADYTESVMKREHTFAIRLGDMERRAIKAEKELSETKAEYSKYRADSAKTKNTLASEIAKNREVVGKIYVDNTGDIAYLLSCVMQHADKFPLAQHVRSTVNRILDQRYIVERKDETNES